MKQNILIAEDDADIVELLTLYLDSADFCVCVANNGIEALEIMKHDKISLALVDIMMPEMNGYEFIKEVRQISDIPIIIISARNQDADKIMGLDIGADAYISKPFNPLEVVARVKTQLRRYQRYNNPAQIQPAEKSEYDIRGLIINKDSHKCFLFGKELQLTPIEFSILWYLCEHQGKVVPSEELFEAVWKEKYLNNNNTVMAHIGRLREKMNEPAKKPKFIKTVWGVGYEIE